MCTEKTLNATSKYPERYKFSVITGPIQRAYKICSSRDLFSNEINESKQILINNGCTNSEFGNE